MVDPVDLELSADWRTVQSGETYTGYRQSTGFTQQDVARFDAPAAYLAPVRLALNDWALAGVWTVAGHAVVANEPSGRIAFQFHARDVNLVIGPASKGASIQFKVYLEGRPVGDARGRPTGRPS